MELQTSSVHQYLVDVDGAKYQVTASSYREAAQTAVHQSGGVLTMLKPFGVSYAGHVYLADASYDSGDLKMMIVVWHPYHGKRVTK